MGIGLRVNISDLQEFERRLGDLPTRVIPGFVRDLLLALGFEVQKVASRDKIKRGGSAPPLPDKLTSRTGTLRRSIAVDRGPLPRAIVVGTPLIYGSVHETGGRFVIPRHRVRSHTRNVAFGRRVAPFTVPSFDRGPYTMSVPPRPFLGPAWDEVRRQRGENIIRSVARQWDLA